MINPKLFIVKECINIYIVKKTKTNNFYNYKKILENIYF